MARFVITSKPLRQRRALVPELVSGDGLSPDTGQFVSLGLGCVLLSVTSCPLAEDKVRVTAAEKMDRENSPVLIHLFISQGKTCSNCFSYSLREKVRVLRNLQIKVPASSQWPLHLDDQNQVLWSLSLHVIVFHLNRVSASHWVLSSSPGRLGECPSLRNNRTLESSRSLGRMVDTCLWAQGRKSKSWTGHWP